MPGARMRWMVTTKFSPVRIEENPATKMAKPASIDIRVAEGRAEGRVEGPAGIDAAGQHAVQHHRAGDDVEIPAQQVDAREGEIFGADHHRHKEVAEHGGNRRDQEEEDHHHAVHGEKLVVSIGLDEIAGGREQFEADEQGEESADEKEESDGDEIEQRDALVVGREQPRADAILLIQVILALDAADCCRSPLLIAPEFLLPWSCCACAAPASRRRTWRSPSISRRPPARSVALRSPVPGRWA